MNQEERVWQANSSLTSHRGFLCAVQGGITLIVNILAFFKQ